MESDKVFGFRGTASDMVAKESTQLFLLAKSGDTEVIKQTVAANRPISLTVCTGKSPFEFIYILDGKIQHKETGQVLQEGDFILVHNIAKQAYLKTLTPVTFLCVTNSPVFYDQKQQIEQLLKLTAKVEEKDRNTERHCHRLQEITAKVGQALGLDDEDLFHLVYAALLHDVGKNNVPEKILVKPTALNDEEWQVIKQHPIWGQEIIYDYLGEGKFTKVAKIVLQHHERYDGLGYPDGLAGDDILLEAQILSIADAYDAMVSDRPYRKGLAPEVACMRIANERGKQFNPVVVDAFLALEKSFR